MGLIPFVVTEKSVVLVRGEDGLMHILLIKASGINLPLGINGYEAGCIIGLAAGNEPSDDSPDDLTRNILFFLGGSLSHVAIVGMTNDTFLARVFFQKDNKEFSLPAYPSDAVVLGLSFKVPMLIDEQILIDGTSNEDTQEFLSIIQENAPQALES